MKANAWIALGAISGFLSVGLGAFGAHGLKEKLSEYGLSIYHTGAQYQMYHSLAILAVGLWAAQHPQTSTALPGWAFTAGILIFSGSLYALALTEIRWLGAITPIGGLCFLIGWLAFAWVAFKNS